MGACLSSSSSKESSVTENSALVISINGDLRQHPVPVTVSQVLQSESSTSTSTSSSASFFVCNSDGLYYDEFISPLDSELELDAGQIYFILPAAKLRYRLSASDMAALAVKASLALSRSSFSSNNNNNDGGATKSYYNSNKARVSPFVVTEPGSEKSMMNHKIDITVDAKRYPDHQRKQQRAASLGVSKSGSIRKLQRLSSRKALSAVRSFRLRLSTIYESSDPQLY